MRRLGPSDSGGVSQPEQALAAALRQFSGVFWIPSEVGFCSGGEAPGTVQQHFLKARLFLRPNSYKGKHEPRRRTRSVLSHRQDATRCRLKKRMISNHEQEDNSSQDRRQTGRQETQSQRPCSRCPQVRQRGLAQAGAKQQITIAGKAVGIGIDARPSYFATNKKTLPDEQEDNSSQIGRQTGRQETQSQRPRSRCPQSRQGRFERGKRQIFQREP